MAFQKASSLSYAFLSGLASDWKTVYMQNVNEYPVI